jgi:hypothetical protein
MPTCLRPSSHWTDRNALVTRAHLPGPLFRVSFDESPHVSRAEPDPSPPRRTQGRWHISPQEEPQALANAVAGLRLYDSINKLAPHWPRGVPRDDARGRVATRSKSARRQSFHRIAAGGGIHLENTLKVETRVRTPLGLPGKPQVRALILNRPAR